MAMTLGDSIRITHLQLQPPTDRKQPFAPQGSSYEGDGAVLAGPCPSCAAQLR